MTSQNIIIDSDIEKLLHDSYLSSVRKTEEYQFGRFEEKQESEKDLFKKSFDKVVGIADTFFEIVKNKFPGIKIKQFRIGIDYSSRIPAALMLIDDQNQKDVVTIRNLARSIEKISWSHGISDCYLWTKVDKNLELEMIEADFPFYRKNI